MTSAVQPASRRPAGRGLVLLVLAVLAGVLAMHGLGPGPAPAKMSAPAGSHAMLMSHGSSAQDEAVAAVGDCSHTAGGTGHAKHADATCAATGIGAPYAPPALAPALDGAPASRVTAGGPAAAVESGRAPPDLAQLQLLRI